MRTTLNIDDAVLARLRERAERAGRSVGEIASDLLAVALDDDEQEAEPLLWESRPMGRPRVDYHDKDALWAALDDEREAG